MGEAEIGVEGAFFSLQHNLSCKGLLEKIEADRVSKEIYERVQFPHAGHQEHVGGRQIV